MNKNTIILLLIFVLPLVAYFALSQKNESNIAVTSTVKPQIIKFSSAMCSECVKMDKVIKTVYPKYQNEVQLVEIPVHIQNDYNSQMIAKYDVTLVPTTVFITKNNRIMKRVEGSISNSLLDKYIRELINDWYNKLFYYSGK